MTTWQEGPHRAEKGLHRADALASSCAKGVTPNPEFDSSVSAWACSPSSSSTVTSSSSSQAPTPQSEACERTSKAVRRALRIARVCTRCWSATPAPTRNPMPALFARSAEGATEVLEAAARGKPSDSYDQIRRGRGPRVQACRTRARARARRSTRRRAVPLEAGVVALRVVLAPAALEQHPRDLFRIVIGRHVPATAKRNETRAGDRAGGAARLAGQQQAVLLTPCDRDRHGDLLAATEVLVGGRQQRLVEPGRARERTKRRGRVGRGDLLGTRSNLAEDQCARQWRDEQAIGPWRQQPCDANGHPQ